MDEQVDILLVDDSPVKLLAMETALGVLNQRLHKASSGREALRLLLGHDFAVVLLDVNMPGLDGFETAELIRARERSSHTPIIFVSAISQTEAHASRGYQLGAVDYVFAPIVPDVLRAKVAVFVELHRKTVQAQRQAEKIAADARELTATSERLRHAERLASLGTLAAGLGHDMGNLLLPVRFRLESIEAQAVSAEVKEDVGAIRKCTDYLQQLARGLRLLALDTEDEQASDNLTDLRAWWPDLLPVLRGCLPRDVALEERMAASEPVVKVPAHRLSQAVFNLVQNAADALRVLGKGRVQVWAENAGQEIRLGVTDDGPGMSEEVQRRCLEPFFTTKTRAISTGLGLSLVQGVVARAGGRLEFKSREGVGTTFTMVLPRAAGVTRKGVAKAPAAVWVADPQRAGYIAAILSSLKLQPQLGEGKGLPEAPLWVVDGDRAPGPVLKQFCEGSPARRVVVIGELASNPAPDQIIATGEHPAPATVREALRKASAAAALYSPTALSPGASNTENTAERGRPAAREVTRDGKTDQAAVRGRQPVGRRGDRKAAQARA